MCTPIYYVHNITLWSCPTKITCPTIYVQKLNKTSQLSPSPTPYAAPSPVHPSPSYLLAPAPTPYAAPSPNPYAAPSPVHPSPSYVLSPSPKTQDIPRTTTRPPLPKNAPSPSTKATRTTQNLRNQNKTNQTLDLSSCLCESNLDYLHILWVVPAAMLMFCCIWFKRRAGVKITNLYQRTRLRRSRSWPQMTVHRSPIQNRAQSSPPFDSIVI